MAAEQQQHRCLSLSRPNLSLPFHTGNTKRNKSHFKVGLSVGQSVSQRQNGLECPTWIKIRYFRGRRKEGGKQKGPKLKRWQPTSARGRVLGGPGTATTTFVPILAPSYAVGTCGTYQTVLKSFWATRNIWNWTPYGPDSSISGWQCFTSTSGQMRKSWIP